MLAVGLALSIYYLVTGDSLSSNLFLLLAIPTLLGLFGTLGAWETRPGVRRLHPNALWALLVAVVASLCFAFRSESALSIRGDGVSYDCPAPAHILMPHRFIDVYPSVDQTARGEANYDSAPVNAPGVYRSCRRSAQVDMTIALTLLLLGSGAAMALERRQRFELAQLPPSPLGRAESDEDEDEGLVPDGYHQVFVGDESILLDDAEYETVEKVASALKDEFILWEDAVDRVMVVLAPHGVGSRAEAGDLLVEL